MRIAIIGGGAIGLLYAAFLSRTNKVTIYTRTKEQAEQLTEHGLTYILHQMKTVQPIYADVVTEFEPSMFDLAIICVKQYALAGMLSEIKVDQQLPLLFLQNGMGHLELLNTLPSSTVIVGSVEHGSLKRNPYTVEHTGIGLTKLAYVRKAEPNQHLLTNIADEWQTDAFLFQIEHDYMLMLQDKLVANAVINPLTAVLGVRNGQLLENPYYYHLFLQLTKEVTEVLGLDLVKYTQHVEGICKRTATNQSSMYKDVVERNHTEIEAISGYVLSIAKKKGVNVPLCSLLYHWIKGMEYKGEN